MARKRKLDPNKSQHRIVAQFEDSLGNKIALLAHQGFKWKIYCNISGEITITETPREQAKKEYKRLKKIYKPLDKKKSL